MTQNDNFKTNFRAFVTKHLFASYFDLDLVKIIITLTFEFNNTWWEGWQLSLKLDFGTFLLSM